MLHNSSFRGRNAVIVAADRPDLPGIILREAFTNPNNCESYR
jgi:hypothetical protein